MVLAKLKPRSLLFNRRADCTKNGYDAVGQRVRMLEPDGGRFTYWYDGVGQITRLLNPFQENTTFTYDVAGRRTMQKLANRVRASYSYDAADRLTTVVNLRADGTYVSRFDYVYDNRMNKILAIETNNDRLTWTYDRTYQLIRERRSGDNAYDTTYTYDAAQNRKVMVDSDARTTYSYDSANQLSWLRDARGTTTFSYDANGNQTIQSEPSLARITNSWDCGNRLFSVKRMGTVRSTYTYKSENNLRIVSEEATATSRIIWDGQMQLEEANGSNLTQVIYSIEPTPYGNLLSQARSSVSSFYHADSPGSVSNLTNSNAATTDTYIYRAFGTIVFENGSTTNCSKYNGIYGYTQVSDRLYIRRRWLSPHLAQWQSRDPYEFIDGFNLYTYVENSPANLIDPDGRFAITIPPTIIEFGPGDLIIRGCYHHPWTDIQVKECKKECGCVIGSTGGRYCACTEAELEAQFCFNYARKFNRLFIHGHCGGPNKYPGMRLCDGYRLDEYTPKMIECIRKLIPMSGELIYCVCGYKKEIDVIAAGDPTLKAWEEWLQDLANKLGRRVCACPVKGHVASAGACSCGDTLDGKIFLPRTRFICKSPRPIRIWF